MNLLENPNFVFQILQQQQGQPQFQQMSMQQQQQMGGQQPRGPFQGQ